MNALLVLEDGKIFKGKSFGAAGERYGEVVFNTSMTGYQEILTDPSYKGQIVMMTYPLIGNYGINKEDVESRQPFVEGFVVKECSKIASNWRKEKSLGDYLKENNILGIEGIDTRALTLHIREAGAMKAVLSTEDLDEKKLVQKARNSPGLIGIDLVKEVVNDKMYVWSQVNKKGFKVIVLDCGTKYNILRKLVENKCQVVVVPANTGASEILKLKPDGLLLSNGPGDPAAVKYVIDTTKRLIGKVPMFGICLGHQMLGLALGGKTYKLKFGHHGANHPVKDLKTGRVSITTQNHGFCVDIGSLSKKEIEITHINLNDQTLEGMRHKKLPLFSVQFHPEASAGPHDAQYLFGTFIKMMKKYA
ncbi:MAG: glutamine-hydrolyzing carbamoyl-phosphate synthase small subunit [Candidatus Omnitrophica bacterium]|nr:glutamine-hydrolyzing carbamoyl-phosphate synthase small subunit [Candidatus Omnitrophota bacterium]MDD5352073.1 glutamine-hydrolyzing carbamoyl-phosphate synthase small subunit [Candidatus Omnitrophota bacterium]MDD5549671.1 glutamine-hydrolyzing carbamoyl-phosphate synthase small subunit [Candidatus Omnitrophota bacterium]